MNLAKSLILCIAFNNFSCTPKESSKGEEKYTTLPSPKFGIESLYACIQDKLEIPDQAIKAKIEKTVMIEFTVNSKGETLDFRSLNSVGFGCEEAAINALTNCKTEWNPGKENLRTIDMKMKIPITFSLKK